MLNDSTKFTGLVHFKMWDKDGNVTLDKTVKNLVVDTGKTWVAGRMTSASQPVMSHIAVGTDSTAPSVLNTTLGTEVSRVAMTSAIPSGSVVTYVARFNPGSGTAALVEAGIFNDATTGTMLARTTFAVINKGASDTLDITWTITAS